MAHIHTRERTPLDTGPDMEFLRMQDSPFFTVKLNIKMLPCVIFFKNGVAGERVLGFEGLGGKDDFETAALEERMLVAEVVEEPERDKNEERDRTDRGTGNIRKGLHSFEKTASDEDSDFDD